MSVYLEHLNMATCDRIVSQPDVVGHLKAGELKTFVDDSLGDFGSDDCQFLAISSEWVSIPAKEFDQSKLILLKKNIQSVSVESSYCINSTKKKRRRRRKKNKSLIVGKPALDVEIMDGIFIQSAAPVLAMEHGTCITIPSSSPVYSSDNGAILNSVNDLNDGVSINLVNAHLIDGNLQHTISTGVGKMACVESNCNSISVSARQECKEDSQIDSGAPTYHQADLVSQTHQPANYDLTFGVFGGSDGHSSHISQSSIFCKQNQNISIELHHQIQSHPDVIFNGIES